MKIHLVFATMALLLLIFVISREELPAMTFGTVVEQAQRLSREPPRKRKPVASRALRDMNYDQYQALRWREEQTLWREKALPFQVQFFLAAHQFPMPVTIYIVGRHGPERLRYSPAFFDFGDVELSAEDKAAGDYAGFRVHYPLNRHDSLDELLVFRGASYFRAAPKDLVFGISARGLAIDTAAKERKEEFPAFTTFWLVEPAASASEMTVYALLEGASVTGAYEFRVRPGQETTMDVHAVLFPRKRIETLGIAPLTSMFWYGENTSHTFGDFRPEVHDSDGLQIETHGGEWVWRPLSWSQQLQVNVFGASNVKGFGLFQRDREFAHYQDLVARYHERPSLWVQPLEPWGDGTVRLIQLPTDREYLDNVVAFWVPARPVRAGERLEFRYRLVWFRENAALPPTGRCLATRIDHQDQPYYRRFILDFEGGELAGLAPDAPVRADVWAGADGKIGAVTVEKNTINKTWRVTFVVSTDDTTKPVELRCVLVRDDEPLTETWTYTWTH